MPTHAVKQGECVSRIAAEHGFSDWKTVYNDPANADFREQRPNPNILCEGDTLFIPERAKKTATCTTGQTHKFTVRLPTKKLRLVVLDHAGAPVSSVPYKLVVEDKTYSGSTDGDGAIEQVIPVDAETGTLEANGRSWPLRIGHLNPLDDTTDSGVSGAQARLRNLGYDPGPVAGDLGARTKAALRAFQRANALKVDGKLGADTKKKLADKHGC